MKCFRRVYHQQKLTEKQTKSNSPKNKGINTSLQDEHWWNMSIWNSSLQQTLQEFFFKVFAFNMSKLMNSDPICIYSPKLHNLTQNRKPIQTTNMWTKIYKQTSVTTVTEAEEVLRGSCEEESWRWGFLTPEIQGMLHGLLQALILNPSLLTPTFRSFLNNSRATVRAYPSLGS